MWQSADRYAVFVLDFKNKFFFVRIHLARHDLIYLLSDLFSFFFCQILDDIFHLPFLLKDRFTNRITEASRGHGFMADIRLSS